MLIFIFMQVWLNLKTTITIWSYRRPRRFVIIVTALSSAHSYVCSFLILTTNA